MDEPGRNSRNSAEHEASFSDTAVLIAVGFTVSLSGRVAASNHTSAVIPDPNWRQPA
jgi:hypothetical protein